MSLSAFSSSSRSWRYAALERGLSTGLLVHVGGGRFATTEHGVAVLRQIDVRPECGEGREPMIESSYYAYLSICVAGIVLL